MGTNQKPKGASSIPPQSALSQEVLAALGEFNQSLTSNLTASVQATISAEVRVLSSRMDNQDKLLEEKFRHLEVRQSQETTNLGTRLQEDRKAIDKLSDEVTGFKRHMDAELQSLRKEISDARDQFKANNSGIRLNDQQKEIDQIKADVTMLKEAHLKGQGRNTTLVAIWGAIGSFVILGLIYAFTYFAKHP